MEKDRREDTGEYYPGGRVVATAEVRTGVEVYPLAGVEIETSTLPKLRAGLKTVGEALGATVTCLALSCGAFGAGVQTVNVNDIDLDAGTNVVVAVDFGGLATTNAVLEAVAGKADAERRFDGWAVSPSGARLHFGYESGGGAYDENEQRYRFYTYAYWWSDDAANTDSPYCLRVEADDAHWSRDEVTALWTLYRSGRVHARTRASTTAAFLDFGGGVTATRNPADPVVYADALAGYDAATNRLARARAALEAADLSTLMGVAAALDAARRELKNEE